MLPISEKLLGNKERCTGILQFKELRSESQVQGLKQIGCLGRSQAPEVPEVISGLSRGSISQKE